MGLFMCDDNKNGKNRQHLWFLVDKVLQQRGLDLIIYKMGRLGKKMLMEAAGIVDILLLVEADFWKICKRELSSDTITKLKNDLNDAHAKNNKNFATKDSACKEVNTLTVDNDRTKELISKLEVDKNITHSPK